MRTFEEQGEAATLPVLRYLDVPLIPCHPQVMPGRLAEERNFHLAGLCVSAVIGAEVPGPVVKREHPRRVSADFIAIPLRLKDAGKPDSVRQRAAKPLLLDARVSTIQREAPVTGQVKRGAPGRVGCWRQQRQREQEPIESQQLHGMRWFGPATSTA